MRRALWSRALAAFFALWLALVMGDAGTIHPPCPMQGAPRTAGAPDAMHGAHRGHDMASHRAHEQSDPDAPPAGHDHRGASCVGVCAASTSAATVSDALELPQSEIAAIDGIMPAGDAFSRAPDRAPFFLPFANGPPPAIA